MPDKHGEPTSTELRDTAERLLPRSIEQAKKVSGLFAAAMQERFGPTPERRLKEAPAFLGAGQDIPESRQDGALSPEARRAADAFFAYKREHPEPVAEEDKTPLQQRMQSGGA